MKIAIVGSGISGLTCAYYLSRNHDITLFEANNYLGGHSNTILLTDDKKTVAIDTGFIVFNHKTYPNFIKLLSELDCQYKETEMSFSVSCPRSRFEYSSKSFTTFFPTPSSLLSRQRWRLLRAINRFNRFSLRFLKNPNACMTIGDFLKRFGFSTWFQSHYINAMAAAIWSMPINKIQNFPALFLLKFLDNHGLLTINNQPKWLTIGGGAKQYVDALVKKSNATLHCNAKVEKIIRKQDAIELAVNKQKLTFDKVIIAVHSDQVLALLDKPTEEEIATFNQLPYQLNQAILHTDVSIMPKNRAVWASWNYQMLKNDQKSVMVSYDMNRLQNLKELEKHYFVSLNPQPNLIDAKRIIRQFSYSHPVYNLKSSMAQKNWHKISGLQHSYYCGAYWGYGFHEDGVVSGLKVIKQLKEAN